MNFCYRSRVHQRGWSHSTVSLLFVAATNKFARQRVQWANESDYSINHETPRLSLLFCLTPNQEKGTTGPVTHKVPPTKQEWTREDAKLGRSTSLSSLPLHLSWSSCPEATTKHQGRTETERGREAKASDDPFPCPSNKAKRTRGRQKVGKRAKPLVPRVILVLYLERVAGKATGRAQREREGESKRL